MVLQGFQGFRGGSRGGPVGGPRGPGFTGTKELLFSHWFLKVFEVTVAGPGGPPARPAAGPRGRGESRAKPLFFQWFCKVSKVSAADPGAGRWVAPGGRGLLEPRNCCLPLVLKVFEVTVAGPGAPSGGRPGGTLKKPMNFHVFWSAGRRAHPPPALEAVWRYQSVAAQSILTDTRRTDASRLTQYPPPTLSICRRCFCSWSH